MKQLAPSALILTGVLFSSFALAQVPKPFLHSPIANEAKELSGNFNPLPTGTAPGLELQVKPKGGTYGNRVADFSVNFVRGTFTVLTTDALAEGEEVKVILSVGQNRQESDPVTVSPAPPVSEIDLLGVEAVHGSKKIVVNFMPVASPSGRPKINITAGSLFSFDQPLTDDQIKAGRAEVTLPALLLSKEGGLTVKVKSNKNEKAVTPEAAALQVKIPVREGESVVTGKAAAGVQRVCIAVIGAAFSGADVERRIGSTAAPRNCDDARWKLTGYRTDLLGAAKSGKSAEVQKLAFTTTLKDLDTNRVQQLSSALGMTLGAAQDMTQAPGVRDLDSFGLVDYLQNHSTDIYGSVAELSGELLEEMEVAVDSKDNTFTFTLSRPLEGGTKLLIRQVVPDAIGGPQVALDGPETLAVLSSGIDFGRARVFLTVGATLSQSNESFGRADPYVALTADGTFFNHLVDKKGINGTMQNDSSGKALRSLFDTRGIGASLHWTAAVRLTQTGTISPLSNLTAGLQAAQSAVLLGGLYLPVRVSGMDWIYHGTQYSAFIGPSARAGVTTVRGGVLLSKQTTSVVTTLNPCISFATCSQKDTSPTQENRVTGPAPFYGYGFRTGLMRYDLMGHTVRNRQISPDPVMYLDVTWGQNQAYVTPAVPTETVSTTIQTGLIGSRTVTTNVNQRFTFERRIAVEARLKIPYIPAEIGADVNFNRKAPLRGLSGTGEGSVNYSDFRFIFGFRVDLAKSLSNIFAPKK